MRESISRIFKMLVGDERRNSLEHRLFNTISLLNAVSNLGGALMFNPQIDPFLFLLHATTAVLFFLFYYVSRVRMVYRNLIWPFILLILVFLFANALGNAGSQGGAHYYLIPALVIAVILSRNLTNTLISFALFSLAALTLVAIEFFRPEWMCFHENARERALDVSQNLLYSLIFTGLLVMILSRNLNLERGKSDRLLLNVLPSSIAQELQEKDRVRPCQYDCASVLFTDFVGFTKIAEQLSPEELVRELDYCFGRFDQIVADYDLEKIKTIGDSYMAVGGVPTANRTHAVDAVVAALEIRDFMEKLRKERMEEGRVYWDVRLGINSGGLVAGVVGRQKFVYDVWGDTVNTASRLESSGVPNRVNISEATYEQVKDFIICEYRGKILAKNKGEIEMYFADRIRPELTSDPEGRKPNREFRRLYDRLAETHPRL